MRQNSKRIKSFLTVILAILALMAGQKAWADGWSVDWVAGNKFVVSRTNTASKEIVKYRTVSGSALADVHFTGKSGSLTFNAGEGSKEVSVPETGFDDIPLQYKYQGLRSFYYDFEITDQGGSVLASKRRTYYSGADINNKYYLNGYTSYVNDYCANLTYFYEGTVKSNVGLNYHDESFTPTEGVQTDGDYKGYVLIDDSYDYRYYPATVGPTWLYAMNRAGASGEWHKLIGNKLYASVVFSEKEVYDGYAYVQILIGDANTAYDVGADPNGTVNTPVNSIYKACFELKKGSGAYGGSGKWIFPHSSEVNKNSYSGYAASEFWLTESWLWKQRFRSESYRADSTLWNNAFVLDPDISALTVRFDCGGEGDDTYGYRDLCVRWALIDKTAPTVLSDKIAVSPGFHIKGNSFAISISFSEPVLLDDGTRYVLHTTWGSMEADQSCSGCNVITFYGTITANAGTSLAINSLELVGESGRPEIRDLIGNAFSGSISKTFSGITVEESYTISYNLNGGSVSGTNPAKYSSNSDAITLINPTRPYYVFAGWTGTGLSSPTMTVTIPAGSTGNRTYTATWTPDNPFPGDGTETTPYIISTPEELILFSSIVNDGNSYSGLFIKLGADINMEGNEFTPIVKTSSRSFEGTFDGDGHVISNLTVNQTSSSAYAGLFGRLDGTVKNVILDGANVTGKYITGLVAGYIGSGGTVKNCYVFYSSVTRNYSSSAGALYEGSKYSSPNVKNSYTRSCTVTNNSVSSSSNSMYTVTAGINAVVGGTKIISYAGTDYYKENAAITVSAAPGFTINSVYYTPEGGTSTLATANEDGTWSFTMPANDVTVSTAGSLDLTAHEATVMGDAKYVVSLYDGTTDYQLPEGALAYTAELVNGTAVFYRIGEDSNLVPRGTAVIIVADASALTGGKLTLTTVDASGITARPGNILKGSDTDIAKPDGSVYVLGVNGSGVMDFVKFTGSIIPAGKAYYVAE